jgi:hypothetical protein
MEKHSQQRTLTTNTQTKMSTVQPKQNETKREIKPKPDFKKQEAKQTEIKPRPDFKKQEAKPKDENKHAETNQAICQAAILADNKWSIAMWLGGYKNADNAIIKFELKGGSIVIHVHINNGRPQVAMIVTPAFVPKNETDHIIVAIGDLVNNKQPLETRFFKPSIASALEFCKRNADGSLNSRDINIMFDFMKQTVSDEVYFMFSGMTFTKQ